MDKSEKFFDKVSRRSKRPLKELGQTSLKTIEFTIKYLGAEDTVLDFGYAPRQVDYGTGGPPNASHMYTADMLRDAFDSF